MSVKCFCLICVCVCVSLSVSVYLYGISVCIGVSGGSGFVPNCTYQGYNFSVFSDVDVIGSDSTGNTYAMRLCGTAATCQSLTSLSSDNSMICRYNATSTNISSTATSLVSFSPPSNIYFYSQYVTQFVSSSGVILNYPANTVGSCNAVITFLCNAGVGAVPSSFNATSSGCNVAITIYTNIICAGPTVPLGSPLNPNCGFAGYNLSLLSAYDIPAAVSSTGPFFTMRICGITGNSWCSGFPMYGGSTSSVCQYFTPPSAYSALAVATYNPLQPTLAANWGYTTNGITLEVSHLDPLYIIPSYRRTVVPSY